MKKVMVLCMALVLLGCQKESDPKDNKVKECKSDTCIETQVRQAMAKIEQEEYERQVREKTCIAIARCLGFKDKAGYDGWIGFDGTGPKCWVKTGTYKRTFESGGFRVEDIVLRIPYGEDFKGLAEDCGKVRGKK